MSEEKKYVVVDTWVLAKASENPRTEGDASDMFKANEVLSKIYNKGHKVVLDDEDQIIGEWRRHMYSGSVVYWFKWMQSLEGRIVWRSKGKGFKKINKDDRKFVKVAAVSPHRILITGDTDFIEEVNGDEEAKNHKIRVWNLDEALKML